MRFILLYTFFFFITASPVFCLIPNDPEYKQWAYEDIGVYRAWDKVNSAESIVVAVIDNGFDTFHPDLRENVWKNEDELPDNQIDDDKNGYIDDVWGWNFVAQDSDGNGKIDSKEALGNNNPRPDASIYDRSDPENDVLHHGTAIAGIIGAVGNNGLDGAGINWNVKLMNVRIIDSQGYGDYGNLEKAIHYAVDNGAHIINISIIGGKTQEMKNAVEYAYENGVVIVAAAGNGNIALNYSPYYPVCIDEKEDIETVLGVSAINEDHHLALFSNSGSNCINITAPGTNISSTLRFSPKNGLNRRYGGSWNGTSFAAPLVSGAAALVKSIQPGWKPAEIFEALLSTVQHTAGQNEEIYANLFGAGLLQIDKAVQYALDKRSQVKNINSIFAIDLENGDVVERKKETGVENAKNLIQLKNASNIVSYSDKNESGFIVAKHINKSQISLEFYSNSWNFIRSWSAPAAGPVSIAVGDVLGDSSTEIIIAPNYGSDRIFRVFSIYGTQESQHSLSRKHSGVSLAVNKTGLEEKDQIVALYKDNGELAVNTFSGEGTLVSSFVFTHTKNRGDIVSADIDEDGVDEYIIGAGKEEDPFLIYLESNGKLLRKFWTYSTDYKRGFHITKGDYDDDGRDDIIVWPEDGNQPVRVWSYRSKKLLQWWPFGNENMKEFAIVPVYN